jgi:predicted nucleotidyltransferase
MRITRELMLKFAKDTIARQARESRSLLAAYLCGSMLGDDFLLGGAGDIDLVLIHEEQSPVEREVIPLNEEIHLDIAHHYRRDYRDTRRLRVHPWLGPTLNACKALYDPQHFVDFTQASVRGQFDRPDHISERARVQAEMARQVWQDLAMATQAGGPALVADYLRAVGFAANAVASLSGPPLVERRFLQQFPARAEAIGRPGLFQGLLGLLGAQHLEAQVLSDWLPHWQTAYQSLPASEAPIHLHPVRLNYYLGAFKGMIQEEQPVMALWPLLRTWTMLAALSPENSPVCQTWQSAVEYLGVYGADFGQRLEALDAYLDLVEETLETWARQNGA